MSKKNIIPAYSVFLLNNSNYQNYYQTYMREYIGQTLFDVICGAVNMPVAVQYVLSSIIYSSKIYQFCKHNYELTLPLF